MSTSSVGDIGEVIAIEYLQKKGYSIQTTNFKFGRFGEIDIIAEKLGRIFFIEVKYRISEKFGTPEESITPAKLRKFKKTIEFYCVKHSIDFGNIEFNVIAIKKGASSHRVTHYKNVEI